MRLSRTSAPASDAVEPVIRAEGASPAGMEAVMQVRGPLMVEHRAIEQVMVIRGPILLRRLSQKPPTAEDERLLEERLEEHALGRATVSRLPALRDRHPPRPEALPEGFSWRRDTHCRSVAEGLSWRLSVAAESLPVEAAGGPDSSRPVEGSGLAEPCTL